jgi:hypothetical protein
MRWEYPIERCVLVVSEFVLGVSYASVDEDPRSLRVGAMQESDSSYARESLLTTASRDRGLLSRLDNTHTPLLPIPADR